VLHPDGTWCTGCGRSLLEIERWPAASFREKHEILRAAASRLETLNGLQ